MPSTSLGDAIRAGCVENVSAPRPVTSRSDEVAGCHPACVENGRLLRGPGARSAPSLDPTDSIVIEGTRQHHLPEHWLATPEALSLAWDEREGATNPPSLIRA